MAIKVPVDFDANGAGLENELTSSLKSATRGAGKAGEQAGSAFGSGAARSARKVAGALLGGGALFGAANLVKSAVNAEAQFSQSMSLIRANITGATDASIAELDKLAIKLGADTVFSAGEAADAMLELAKGGFSQVQIAGGGVQATMALAASEGLNLADAAVIVSNNMNAFSISADRASTIADALAAGSAASSASVQSLSEGLSNVGGVARNFGLDLQETVGVLAAFDQNALRGAEGGTSFRSMLTALARPSEKADGLMDQLGISLTDAHGRFRDITNIAQQFQDKLGGLTEEQRAAYTATIAGSYGQRALNILIKEGAEGLRGYIDQSRELGKAQELADARLTGTAGAMEKLRGAVETAEIELGRALAPTIQDIAEFLSDEAVPAVTDFIDGFRKGKGPAGDLRKILGDLAGAVEDVVKVGKGAVDLFDELPSGVKRTAIEAGIAYLALRKLQSGIAATSGLNFAGVGASLRSAFTTTTTVNPLASLDRYTANSVIQQAKLQGAVTKTSFSLRGLAGASASAAGVGGMLALIHASDQGNRSLATLERVAGSAAVGFSVGGPLGLGIGAIAGAFLDVASQAPKAAQGIGVSADKAAQALAPLDSLSDSINGVTGAYAKMAEQQVANSLAEQDVAQAARDLGLNFRTIVQAQLGNAAASAKVDAALARVNSTVLDAQQFSNEYGVSVSLMTAEQQRAVTAAGVLGQAMGRTGDVMSKEEQQALDSALATGKLGEALAEVPDAKIIALRTADRSKAIADIAALKRQYDLTPKQLTLLMKVAGLTDTKNDLAAINRAANDAAKDRTIRFDVVFNRAKFNQLDPPGRALGGPVRKGQPYIVGEKRAEVFVPNQNGRILPRVPSSTPSPSPTRATTTQPSSITIVQNDYGPTTSRAKVSEMEWALTYGTRARTGAERSLANA